MCHWRYAVVWIDNIAVAGDMNKEHGISHLLRDLHELYYRLCAIDLHKRMNLYHHNAGANAVPDISTSISMLFDKLAPTSKPNRAGTASTTKTIASKRPARPDNTKQPSRQRQEIIKAVSAFVRPQKTFTSIKTSNQYMGDKLRDSTWTHIHAAKLHARQGDVTNAELHAGIAHDALKEAVNYMTEEDYKVLCEEVAKTFKELEV